MRNLYVILALLMAMDCQGEEVIYSNNNESQMLKYDIEEKTRLAPEVWRVLTDEEKEFLKFSFPFLNVDVVNVTGEATLKYNCIAFSIGRNDLWINPWRHLEDFKLQYINAHLLYHIPYHYVPVEALSGNDVDGWGFSSADMMHASVKHSDSWESKLGEYLRITHPRLGLMNGVYGNILISFNKQKPKNIMLLREIASQVAKDSITLTDAEREAVRTKAAQVDKQIRSRYESLLRAWDKEIRTNLKLRVSSNTATYKEVPQFNDLLKMGPGILPLVLEGMLTEENFYLLQLYDALQTDERLKVIYEEGDVHVFEGEQNRAKRTIRMWLEAQE